MMNKKTCMALMATFAFFAACHADPVQVGARNQIPDPSESNGVIYNEPIPASELALYQACQTDDDCVYAQNGCCDCANGGDAVAINTNYATAFESRFNCEDIACTQLAKVPGCSEGTSSCVDGKCAYKMAE